MAMENKALVKLKRLVVVACSPPPNPQIYLETPPLEDTYFSTYDIIYGKDPVRNNN